MQCRRKIDSFGKILRCEFQAHVNHISGWHVAFVGHFPHKLGMIEEHKGLQNGEEGNISGSFAKIRKLKLKNTIKVNY